jgi:hypothetical protein
LLNVIFLSYLFDAQVFSWRSYDDILYVVLPFINSVMAVEQRIIDTNTNATAVAESRTKVVQLEEARKGWQSVLDRDDKLYVDAKAGKLEAVTQLVANALLQNDQGQDNVKFINGTNAPDANALRSVSAIRSARDLLIDQPCFYFSWLCSFGGYGASISYSESVSKDWSNSQSFSVDFSGTVSANIDIELLAFSIGPHLKFSITLGGGFSKSTSVENDKSISRTRGFSLSDGDEYDVFDVQV